MGSVPAINCFHRASCAASFGSGVAQQQNILELDDVSVAFVLAELVSVESVKGMGQASLTCLLKVADFVLPIDGEEFCQSVSCEINLAKSSSDEIFEVRQLSPNQSGR